MISRLGKAQLLTAVARAIKRSGWDFLIISNQHPFRLRIHGPEDRGFDVLVYIWNCTHGGGTARAADEYRIQLTGVVPSVDSNVTTLLLGWHEGYEVFVAFDINMHSGQASASPSIQIKEDSLAQAHQNSFARYQRQNKEIAVAFRPEFFVTYALSADSLHKGGDAAKDLSLLNKLPNVTDTQIATIANVARQRIVAQITKVYRAYDFRARVLGAYDHRCAFCGVQLNLIDAAHIIPVAHDSSTDETQNGIALCKLHHTAFDQSLVSFDQDYKIEVGRNKTESLRSDNRLGGLEKFRRNLRPAILLPNDRRDYPDKNYVTKAREVRKWAE